MKLFGKEEINTGRQFEFDMAKALCIFGMVLVHCFEEFSPEDTADANTLYYVFVIVLDAIFGAATFMGSMGLGISYSSKKSTWDKLISRGFKLFVTGYVLNFFRYALPELILVFTSGEQIESFVSEFFCCDILAFAGLSLMLLGLLKKLKLSNLVIFIISLAMSVIGSIVRFISTGNYVVDILLGLFVGTVNSYSSYYDASFPLFNWFIIVVAGYLYGEALRRCKDTEKYYAISFPISGAIIVGYMLICIPNKLGMLCGDINYYYSFATPYAVILFLGMIFATGIYHYIGKLLSKKSKEIVEILSVNINRVYILQWLIIGWLSAFSFVLFPDGLSNIYIVLLSLTIYIISNLLAEFFRRKKKNKKETV